MPISAVQDPLPRVFAATLGRLVQVDGELGIAQLLTLLIEIISCFGLAAVRVLRTPSGMTSKPREVSLPLLHSDQGLCSGATTEPNATSGIPDEGVIPGSSLNADSFEAGSMTSAMPRKVAPPPSNVLSSGRKGRSAPTHREAGQGRSRPAATASRPDVSIHVREFTRARLRETAGTSLSASDLRGAYEQWCMGQGRKPLSQQKLGAELTAIGFTRFKSYGLIQYRNVRLVAQDARHTRDACEMSCREVASRAPESGRAHLASGPGG
jgi:hypothetical protein